MEARGTQAPFVVILHDVRSAHNVGAMFRTADAVGVSHIYLTGYTGTPHDENVPYTTKAERRLIKTALGAEKYVPWSQHESALAVIADLRTQGYTIAALEQGEGSVDYRAAVATFPLALVLGNEPKGVDTATLAECDTMIEIPMRGEKQSLNVTTAFGIAAYELTRNWGDR